MNAHPYPGKLITFEGLSGIGKSPQIEQLSEWLQLQGHATQVVRRKGSDLLSNTIEQAQSTRRLTATTFSLIHAADLAANLEGTILPALKSGFWVLVNQYIYTALAHDLVRGADPDWAHRLYEFAVAPDLSFYFHGTPRPLPEGAQTSLQFNFYDHGADLDLSPQLEKNHYFFQEKINAQFEQLNQSFAFTSVNRAWSEKQKTQTILAAVQKIQTP